MEKEFASVRDHDVHVFHVKDFQSPFLQTADSAYFCNVVGNLVTFAIFLKDPPPEVRCFMGESQLAFKAQSKNVEPF